MFSGAGGTWTQQAELTASDAAIGDGFGSSVALSGTTALVGAPYRNYRTGAAYVFSGAGGTWTQQAELTASDAAIGDYFGSSVALSGSTALVGAAGHNRTGAAYVFNGAGGTWTQQAELTASDAATGDGFGSSVVLSGSTALVGAYYRNSYTGAAYVFSGAGGTWTQQAELTASDAAIGDYFGLSVALSGSTALVGAAGHKFNTGAAYVFNGAGGTWTQQAELTASDAAIGDQFGLVALSGTTALVGAPGHNNTGAAYVFGVSVLGSQTITFTSTAPSAVVVGGPGDTVTATGGASGNPVTFSIDASLTSGCSLSGSTVSFGGPPGTCVIDANQAGNASYSPAAQAQQSFPVGPPYSFTPTFGTDFGGIIARLHPSGGTGNVSQETATIAWGDGAVTSATLAVSPTDPSELDVTGAHTYWTPGKLPVTITITDPQTGVSSYSGTATVSSQYTAMGDSYSSGEGTHWPHVAGADWWLYQDPSGNPANTDHLNGGVGNTCHRADTADAHVVERLLAALGMTLRFAACSGAVVQDAFTSFGQFHSDSSHQGEGPQLGTLRTPADRFKTSLVTLTFGGNNLDFPGIALHCVISTDDYGCVNQDGEIVAGLGYNTTAGSSKDGTFSSTVTVRQPVSTIADFAKKVSTLIGTAKTCLHSGCNLHDALVLLYRAIRTDAPGARILVLGYPHFFPPGGTGNTCVHFGSLDQQLVNDRVNLVDAVIKDAAAESGVAQYVDTYNALPGHEECTGDPSYSVNPSTYQVSGCSSPGQWINGISIIGGIFGTPENLHPNPCGNLAEGQIAARGYNSPPQPDPAGIASSDTFSLTPGQAQATTLTVPSGLARLSITANWPHGVVAFTLTDPAGASYQPVQTGPVYTTFDLNRPVSGTWKLTATNTTTGDTGTINGSLIVSEPSIPLLPPAGQVRVVNYSCGFIGSTATLSVGVNPTADRRVAQYQWFDDNGQPQTASGPKDDTISMSSSKNQYRVIVLTTGTNGQHRFTTATLTVQC